MRLLISLCAHVVFFLTYEKFILSRRQKNALFELEASVLTKETHVHEEIIFFRQERIHVIIPRLKFL